MKELRSYQLRMAAQAVSGNTLVLLPTGAGVLTLVAAEAILRLLSAAGGTWGSPCGQALFLVPTCMLVS